MSYILDALKKADAERERSAVPGLHAHPQDGLADAARDGRSVPWPALAIGAIVVLGGALAWVLLSDGGVRTPPLVAEAPPATTTTPAAAATATPAPVAEATPAPAPPPVGVAPTPAPAPALAAPQAAPLPPAARTPEAVSRPAPAARPTPAPRAAPRPAPPPEHPAPAPAAQAAAASAETRVPWLNELPASVRAGLPPMAISGAVYAPTPSARMLFVNGQVLREGQATVEGVVVERIGPSSSELSAHGQRFQVRH